VVLPALDPRGLLEQEAAFTQVIDGVVLIGEMRDLPGPAGEVMAGALFEPGGKGGPFGG
jgi:hypothetical protein